jgi:hypothetical protein
VAPLVGAEATVLGATVSGATAEQPESGATGPVSAPWSHTDHDEPTVQRATAVGPLAGGARSSHDAGALDDVVPDAASIGPLLGDVPLTSTLHADRVAPPSSAATPSLPATGTPAVVQRATAPGSSPRGLPGGTSPLQRAAVSRSWSPAEPAEPGAASVFTGLVGTTTLVADAPAPATESVPTQRPPTGPAATPLQRTPVPAGAVVRTTFAAPGARVGPSTPPPSVPASVQRLLAAQAAQAAPQAEVQRVAEAAPETTPAPTASPAEPVAVQTAAAVTAAPNPGAPAQGSGGLTDVDVLVGKLYDPLVRRLKAELRLDRERAGHGLDLRH